MICHFFIDNSGKVTNMISKAMFHCWRIKAVRQV